MTTDETGQPTMGASTGATDPAGPTDQAAAAGGSPVVDRRNFVRAITSDGVVAAGRLAGLTGMLTGSMVAAAKAAGDSFATLGGLETAAPSPAAAPAARPRPAVPPRPVGAPPFTPPPALGDVDRAVLESATLGLLATNQPGGPPAVGLARFRFVDGAFLVPGRSATARTTNLQRAPYASMTVIDPGNGDALLAAGTARLVYGEEGREAAAAVLDACGVQLAEGWERTDSRGEPILVVLELTRLFRRRPADERP
ncbi:MAG: pyridoxamine 5'-phosphate oxidase family protein [Chloroflexota bacterium]